MSAFACCKHALAKTTTPVCIECYKDLSERLTRLATLAQQMREAAQGLLEQRQRSQGSGLPDYTDYRPLMQSMIAYNTWQRKGT